MVMGPGKFDEYCTQIRAETGAIGAVVIVFSGPGESGFSVQGPAPVQEALPQVLRHMAEEIEIDLARIGLGG